MSEWQPIETAPENEAVLIGGGNVLYPVVASYNQDGSSAPWHWDLDAQGQCLERLEVLKPTHWMPLPPAPTGDA